MEPIDEQPYGWVVVIMATLCLAFGFGAYIQSYANAAMAGVINLLILSALMWYRCHHRQRKITRATYLTLPIHKPPPVETRPAQFGKSQKE